MSGDDVTTMYGCKVRHEPEFEHVSFSIPPYNDEIQCTDKQSGVELGYIMYYREKCQYFYYAQGYDDHTSECLRDIASYLEWLNEDV